MNKLLPILISAALIAAILPLAGCSAKKDSAKATTANAQDAIAQAASMTDKTQQYAFLLNEAKGFYSAGKYEDTAKAGEYIVDKVQDTDEVRRLLKKAYEKAMGSMVGN